MPCVRWVFGWAFKPNCFSNGATKLFKKSCGKQLASSIILPIVLSIIEWKTNGISSSSLISLILYATFCAFSSDSTKGMVICSNLTSNCDKTAWTSRNRRYFYIVYFGHFFWFLSSCYPDSYCIIFGPEKSCYWTE